jgi:integrase
MTRAHLGRHAPWPFAAHVNCQIRAQSVVLSDPPQASKWQPPEGLGPEDVLAVIDAAPSERDRLLLRVLWATGARISEALALRPMDIRRDSLVLPNRKNPCRLTKRVFLPAGQADLPGALLLWAKVRSERLRRTKGLERVLRGVSRHAAVGHDL